jgi:RNA polymerase sigma-70 factor (ECF subfamily)
MNCEYPCTKNISVQSLWILLHDRLFKFILRRVSDPNDVEDILQDVFLKVHIHLETIQNVEKIESWVFQIARNSIIDYYRKPTGISFEKELPVFDEYGGEDTAENLAPYIQEIIQTLPNKYREAIFMADYEGKNQHELAKFLGISLSGAKSRVQRARKMIKDVMLACCHFEFDARGIVYDYREHCCCCDGEPLPI